MDDKDKKKKKEGEQRQPGTAEQPRQQPIEPPTTEPGMDLPGRGGAVEKA
jgi:hypothetical protein